MLKFLIEEKWGILGCCCGWYMLIYMFVYERPLGYVHRWVVYGICAFCVVKMGISVYKDMWCGVRSEDS